jgi:2,5-diketo-D-gluconate reductase A
VTQPIITLTDGSTIPQIGLGTYQASPDGTAAMVEAALGTGYRHIDTAMIYRNEAGVGEGLRASGLAREDVYVTTKVWNTDQGFDAALAACSASLDRLGLDYVDLYLVHWPAPMNGLYVDTWRALIRLREEGRVRAIGVSNFNADHLDRIIAETGAIQSWSPLGQGELLGDPVLQGIAQKHGRTVAQVVLRWHIQNGLIVIPKTMHPARMRENLGVFDFALDADDLAKIATLDRADGRMGPDPLTFS